MPKKPIDYSKSLIYTIICNTDESLIYVGSTTDFRRRKNDHKTKSITINQDNRRTNSFLYKMIRENGNWDNFTMKPFKEFPCENKIQLLIEEERIRKELNAKLNGYRAYITAEEQVEEKKEYNHQRWINITQEEKEILNEKKKDWYHQNKEKESLRKKKSYVENKEQIDAQHKAYYEENKEKIALQRKLKKEALALENKI
jgi:predicted GIY-YIG superfamily endonuclease